MLIIKKEKSTIYELVHKFSQIIGGFAIQFGYNLQAKSEQHLLLGKKSTNPSLETV